MVRFVLSRAIWAALAAALLVCWAPGSTAAQDGPTDEQRAAARALYAEGQRHFAAGEFAEALTAFQGAYDAVPNPVVLLGVASAQEGAGDRLAAARTLRIYLRDRADAPDRASVTERIATLDPEGETVLPTTGTVRVTCTPAGAAIRVDGEATEHTAPTELTLAAGPHTLTLVMEGFRELRREITVVAGGAVDLTVTLVSVAEAEAEPLSGEDDVFGTEAAPDDEAEDEAEAEDEVPTDAGQGGPSPAVWVTTAIAGVGLVTGTVFGFLALSAQSDFDSAPTTSSADNGETFALVADLAFGVAVAAGITAIVLYATETPSSSDSASAEDQGPRVAFAPVVGRDAGGATLRVEF